MTLDEAVRSDVLYLLCKSLNPTLNIAVSDVDHYLYDRLTNLLFREITSVFYLPIETCCLINIKFKISILENAPS